MSSIRKPAFDGIRAICPAGVFNEPGNVLAVDNLLDALGAPRDVQWAVGSKGRALVQQFEGCRLTAYPDPGTGGKPWTIGWGATTDEKGLPIRPGTVWSQARADARLEQTLAIFAADVAQLIGAAPTSQEQFDALVSFAYNCGSDIDLDDVPEGLGDSTLLKLHLRGDYAGAASNFAKWNKAGGRVLAGLTRRRAEEAALYRSGIPK